MALLLCNEKMQIYKFDIFQPLKEKTDFQVSSLASGLSADTKLNTEILPKLLHAARYFPQGEKTWENTVV